MNVTIKEQHIQSSRDMCKKHNAKVDRELLRICPSKLSKRDLEDLYLAMLDNNLELKRTINTLQDNNKLLNTKVHRMTAAQKTIIGKERDCCSTTKAMIHEQRDTIADLKKVNERMSERIRVLNMRLCSAKQFLRRSPSQTTWRGIKSLTAPPASLKNSSVSMLNTKESENSHKTMPENNEKNLSLPIEKVAISTKTVQTATSDLEMDNSLRECNENKCRTLMDELKQKIVGLQEELTNCHKDYTSRISRLESEMTTLHREKLEALSSSSLELQQRSQRLERLAAKLRTATAHCNELEAQLLIERSKVSELETRLRAVDISNQIARTVESHIPSPPKNEPTPMGSDLSSSYWNESSPRLEVPLPRVRRRLSPSSAASCDDTGVSKHSDDSGYTDANNTSEIDKDKALAKVNDELIKKIMDLQKQLDVLRVSNAGKTTIDSAQNNMDVCPTPIEKTGQQHDLKSQRDGTKKELQKVDCNPNTSKTASTDRKDKCQKQHSEKKTQELNKINKLLENYDTSFNKKNLDENGSQSKTEEKLLLTINETNTEQENKNFGKQKSLITNDKLGLLAPDISEKKTSNSIKSSYEKVRDAINIKLKIVNSTQGSKNNVPFEDKKFTEEKLENKPDELKNKADLDVNSDIVAKSDLKLQSLDEKVNSRNDINTDVMTSTDPDKKNHENAKVRKEFSTTTFVCSGVQSNVPVNEKQNIQPTGILTDVPPNPRSPPSECDTYTVQNPGVASRSASPDNTDQEISSITDLPSEKDSKSSRAPLSPGEDRITSTYTESYTETYTEHTNNTTDAGSLSEGELPMRYAGRKPSTECRERAVATAQTNPVPVAQKMEATLQSIGEELARCRQLLESQRPQKM